MKQVFIGFDVGGTNIEAGLVAKSGQILATNSHATQNRLGKKQIAKNVIKVAEDLLSSQVKLKGIVLGWPSVVNLVLSGQEIKNILQKKFRVPIILENDANIFALSEAIIGQGKKYSTVVGLTLGTGVGSALVIDKKLYHGRGKASEFGHVSLNFDGPKCVCGNFGCFEEYAGSRALKRLAKKYKLGKQNGESLYELAIQGNKQAIKLWQEFGQQLGWGVVSVINVFDPDIIIIGGQITKAWKFFHKTMQQEVKTKAMFKNTPVKVSKLKNTAIAGAALLLK
jgi:glucokinase